MPTESRSKFSRISMMSSDEVTEKKYYILNYYIFLVICARTHRKENRRSGYQSRIQIYPILEYKLLNLTFRLFGGPNNRTHLIRSEIKRWNDSIEYSRSKPFNRLSRGRCSIFDELISTGAIQQILV